MKPADEGLADRHDLILKGGPEQNVEQFLSDRAAQLGELRRGRMGAGIAQGGGPRVQRIKVSRVVKAGGMLHGGSPLRCEPELAAEEPPGWRAGQGAEGGAADPCAPASAVAG